MLRTATLASSLYFLTCLARSRRRSSLSAGKTRREVQTDLLAVVLRVDAEVGRENGLLNALEHGAVPRLDEQRAGVRRAHRRDLLDGRRRAVVIDRDAVEHGGIRLARAHGVILLGEDRSGLFHLGFKLGIIGRHMISSYRVFLFLISSRPCRRLHPSRHGQYSADQPAQKRRPECRFPWPATSRSDP